MNGLSKRPLLVIAGAGSGKTSTLAHRVPHLIVNGADPRPDVLMTLKPDRGRYHSRKRATTGRRSHEGAGPVEPISCPRGTSCRGVPDDALGPPDHPGSGPTAVIASLIETCKPLRVDPHHLYSPT